MEKVILQLFSESQTHSRAWNGKWRGSDIFYQNLYSLVLQCPLLAKVMLSSWKHRTWARFVCTLAGAGIPSLGVVAKHQGWNPSGEEHFRRSNITPGWISKTAGWNDQKQQKCDSRVKIHRGQVPEAHWKAFLPPAEQVKAKGPWNPIEICNRNWPRGAYSANAGVEQEFW